MRFNTFGTNKKVNVLSFADNMVSHLTEKSLGIPAAYPALKTLVIHASVA